MNKERVNLQYTIEMDELGSEVSRLLSAAKNQLDGVAIPVPSNDDDALALNTLESVDEIRQRLAKLDYCLRDINNIIGAYINYRTAISQQEQNSEIPSESGVSGESPTQE